MKNLLRKVKTISRKCESKYMTKSKQSKSQKMWGGHKWQAWVWAYNGGSGRSPQSQRGTMEELLVRSKEAKPPLKLKTFQLLDAQWKQQIRLILCIL